MPATPPSSAAPGGAVALAQSAVQGDRRSLARVLTVLERGGPDADAVALELHAHAADPFTVGLTGAPGAGKSTLTDALIAEIRSRDERIAAIAIDPSSPFTGGAILGDRVRLRGTHSDDDDVYMRSLSNRGHMGGLSRAVPDVVRAFGACGWPTMIIETVGVGQVEVEIAGQADTTVVVVNPGWGDEVQANKAGLMEVADVMIVNKADREGARIAMRDLRRMLAMAGEREWTPPIVATIATEDDGIAEAWDAILSHREHITATGELERRRGARLQKELHARAVRALTVALQHAEHSAGGRRVLAQLKSGDIAPSVAAERLIAELAHNQEDAGER